MTDNCSARHSRFQFGAARRSILCLDIIAIITALTLFYLHSNSADQNRETEAALSRIETRAQEIHTLGWLVTTTQEVSPEAEQQVQAAKRDLSQTAAALRPETYNRDTFDKIRPALANYIQAADRQLQLVRTGYFEDAEDIDFQQVTPQFEALQYQVHDASEKEAKLAEEKRFKSRIELATAILLSFGSLILGLLFQRQAHLGELMRTKQAALEQSEERFRALTEKSTDIVFITDSAAVINYVSPSVKTALGLESESFLGVNLGELVHRDDFPRLAATLSTEKGQQVAVEFRLRHSDGTWLYFECLVRNLLSQRNINGLVFNAREITERKTAEEQLLHNASHDQLTGLPNRVLFLNRLEAIVDRVKRHPSQLAAVLFIDLDDFKVVNDCLGHASGDELIVEFGKRLKGCMRGDGTIARMGGDEFTVLLEEVSDPSDAIRVAQRIHAASTKPFVLNGQEVFKDVSIGIALVAQRESAESVLQNADLAMYRAKSKGRGCSELFDAAMQEQVMGRLQMETQLRRALQNDELRLFYQPIVAAGTGRIEGFEALLRWQPKGSDSIPPNVFIPLAEQSGLIVPIGSWVLSTACMQAVSWHRRYPSDQPLYVSINISGRQFSHPSFIGHVKDALEQSGIDARCVKLELTETAAMKDAPSTEKTMSQLHALGVKLSIDDFGTGYSSLSYLRRFAVDTLKIDQSFVSKMEESRENYAIVRTVVALSRSLGLDVVAEGVETLGQLEKLKLADCDSAQGYLFSKPLPAHAVNSLLESNRDVLKICSQLPVSGQKRKKGAAN
jgi:diguanylate cyclase (GGDEF)-like protein/PAS domain S-box-containing protein